MTGNHNACGCSVPHSYLQGSLDHWEHTSAIPSSGSYPLSRLLDPISQELTDHIALISI